MINDLSRQKFEDLFQLKDTITRGHSLALRKRRSNLELRKHFFSERVVNRWNSLHEVTVTAGSLLSFEKHLAVERKNKIDLFGDV